ncbi:YEATS domain-containing protein 4 [Phakopsora pachyrhizi]|uniref:Protein AF-9 homolog n=1 Tax=Phakopsora pachyrhizi TaxID=170000 RepID=A0AAV0B4R0_PHAPC|nr:YEATS domain-containing protein 4 [Phakopsora pachyrhizi]CAH7678307.1 YEATS domain-containing protein 4 [Phakopsora pachyrhizi]
MTDKKRLKGITVHRPIVYGSVATMIPVEERIANPDQNMRWTVALRSATSPPPDSDILKQRSIEGDIIGGADNLSHFIKKVSFKIHNSYPNPLKMIDRAPYEINETGWGEFLIYIKMYFVSESDDENNNEKNESVPRKDYNQPEQSERASPGDLNSIKTLVNQHQSSTALTTRSNLLSPNSSKLIHSWQYNEIIGPKGECGNFSLEIEEKEFKKLSLAKMKVLIETNQLRGALVRSEKELNETKRFI